MITYKLFTNQGERENNEDYIGTRSKADNICFVLADGLGGHGKGEVASQTAVEAALALFEQEADTESMIGDMIQHAQEEVYKAQRSDRSLSDMKTTMVVCKIGKTAIQWGHVGDSRLYYFYGNKLIQRTLDHSVPQMLVRSKEIKEKDIRNHPDRNRLLRVIGVPWEQPMYEVAEPVPMSAKKRQALLLCTDGFWELITEKEMTKLLKKAESAEQWIDQMAKLVREKGTGTNMDNYSAIGIFIQND